MQPVVDPVQTKSLGHSLGHTSDSLMPNFCNFANELGLLIGSDLRELRLSEKVPNVSRVTFSEAFSPPTYNRPAQYHLQDKLIRAFKSWYFCSRD